MSAPAEPSNLQRGLAEAAGTFTLTFAGSSALALFRLGQVGVIEVALAHGLALMVAVYAFGKFSGAVVNPAITWALAITGKIPPGRAILYVAFQLLGAIVAGAILRYIFDGFVTETHLGTNDLTGLLGVSAGEEVRGFVVEMVLTFFLTIAVFAVAIDRRAPAGFAGLAIGLTLGFAILAGGPITTGSLNPARTFGPSLLASHWHAHWVFWAGPLAGATVAGLLYNALFLRGEQAEAS